MRLEIKSLAHMSNEEVIASTEMTDMEKEMILRENAKSSLGCAESGETAEARSF